MSCEVTINREVKIRGGPVGWVQHFYECWEWFHPILSLVKLRNEHKNKINLKIDSNNKESTHGEMKKREEQIARFIGSLFEQGGKWW